MKQEMKQPPSMRTTLSENNSHDDYSIPGTPALPPPQIDKEKHEGQILSNIDLSKHSPHPVLF